MPKVNDYKWKIKSLENDNGVIKYVLVYNNGESVINCSSTKPENEVYDDIEKALKRLNSKPKNGVMK